MKRMQFTLLGVALACAMAPLLDGCAAKPETGCQGGLNTELCFKQCAKFATCGVCAAQPACGWCAPDSGSPGQCIPALNGEDHRSERPDSHCKQAWFYRPADLSVPSGAGFCPGVPSP
jgi:hypothetical protein